VFAQGQGLWRAEIRKRERRVVVSGSESLKSLATPAVRNSADATIDYANYLIGLGAIDSQPNVGRANWTSVSRGGGPLKSAYHERCDQENCEYGERRQTAPPCARALDSRLIALDPNGP
jgi:hypothetical protein